MLNSISAITGGKWTGNVYFDEDASSDSAATKHIFNHSEIPKKLQEFVSPQDNAEEVYLYKCPLSRHQVTDSVLKHVFVVVKTKDAWWSLEKDTRGITIQRDAELKPLITAKTVIQTDADGKQDYHREDRAPGISIPNILLLAFFSSDKNVKVSTTSIRKTYIIQNATLAMYWILFLKTWDYHAHAREILATRI